MDRGTEKRLSGSFRGVVEGVNFRQVLVRNLVYGKTFRGTYSGEEQSYQKQIFLTAVFICSTIYDSS